MTTDTNQDSILKRKIELLIEKNFRTIIKKLILSGSFINGTISFSTQSLALLHLFTLTSLVRSNVITSIGLNSLSLAINTYSLINYFRERKLYRKHGLEKTKEDNHKLQGIALDFLCDICFLAAALSSFILIGNPIALSLTLTFLTLGTLVMGVNIGKSIFHQVQRFKNDIVQPGKKEQLYKEEMKHYFTYRFIAHFSITLALSLWHTKVEKEKSMKTIEFLKAKDTSQDAVAKSYNPINEPSVRQSEIQCTPREEELAKSTSTDQHKNSNIQHQKQVSQDVSSIGLVEYRATQYPQGQ